MRRSSPPPSRHASAGSRANLLVAALAIAAFACDATPKKQGASADSGVAATGAAAGAGTRAEGGSPAVAKTGPGRADPAGPGVREDGEIVSAVQWFEGDFDAALAAAQAGNKQLLVDVGAYWCPPCHRLDEELFVLPEVGAFLQRGFVAVHIDAEQGSGPELVERYDVQAYPTMLVLESSGAERGRIVDFVDAQAFFSAVDRISRGESTLDGLDAQAMAAPADLELAYKAGHAYAIAAKRDDAERHFARVLAGDADDKLGLASKVAYDRAMFFDAKLDDAPEKAVKAYRALQAKFPNSKSARRAYRQIGRELNKLGRSDQAIASLDAMLAIAPKDTSLVSSYGWFCFRQNCRPARGLEVVLAGLVDAPDDADLHYLAAELSALTDAPAQGLTHIRKAAQLEPKRAFYRRQIRRFEALVAGVPAKVGEHP